MDIGAATESDRYHVSAKSDDPSSSPCSSSSSSAATDIPAIPTVVHLGLSIVYTALYSLLFILVYAQLLLILCYRHKRFSYQTAFLFLCLIWAALRTTLFSFYFNNLSLANNLPLFPFWLLYCFPVCLQFITLSLLVMYFSQVVFNAKTKFEPSNFRCILRIVVCLAVVTFMVTNMTCAVIIKHQEDQQIRPYGVVMARVLINEMLFLGCGVSLAICIFRLAKMTSAKLILETKGTTLCQTTATCVLVVLLYLSRASYNIVVLFVSGTPSFSFSWINVSDQADMKPGFTYITFGVVLFVWEFLPTFVVVLFFRVRRPSSSLAVCDLSGSGRTSRAHFFDNPRRYDSDEELFKSGAATSSHESPGRTVEYYVARTNHRPSPCGSYMRNDSVGRSSMDGGSTSTGSQPENSLSQPSSSTMQPVFVHRPNMYNERNSRDPRQTALS